MPRRLMALALGVALVASACGGSDDAASGIASLEEGDAVVTPLGGDDGTTADMTSEEAMLALAECLRDQGVDVDDPELGDDGTFRPGQIFRVDGESTIDREQFRDAMDACAEYRDAIVTEFAGADRTEMEDQIYEYAACMRENGYDMPDPDFSIVGERGQGEGDGEGFGGGPFSSLDTTDPAFQAANEVCQDLFGGGFLPGGGGGPGGGAPPPDGGA